LFCQECPKKPFCSELCPEAILFSDQDQSSQKEFLLGEIKYSNPANHPIPPPEDSQISKTEKKILMLLAMGMDRREISKLLDISRNNLRVRLHGLKRKFNAFPHL
jgi:DNA-binding CsgD family transcriptional regulator